MIMLDLMHYEMELNVLALMIYDSVSDRSDKGLLQQLFLSA